MKNQFMTFSMALISIVLCSCHFNTGTGIHSLTLSDSASHFMPVDSANKMLGSYLNSINYQYNDTDIRSLTVDVKQLRRYIDSMSGSDSITSIKLMFAHTLSYANSSKVNTNAGYKSNALTIIIAAYKANGSYVYYTGNTVLDYTQPCPPVCPAGQAANPFLTANQ